jgi:hypothetical protein
LRNAMSRSARRLAELAARFFSFSFDLHLRNR